MNDCIFLRTNKEIEDDVLEFIHYFNQISNLDMQLRSPSPSYWFSSPSSGGTGRPEDFEIIHTNSDMNEIKEKRDFLFNYFCNKYHIRNISALEFILTIKEFFIHTNIKKQHNFTYCISSSSVSILGHLHKIIQILNKDGFIRKLLDLKLEHYDFNGVIVNNNDDEMGFIIEENNIYYASLDQASGCYKKGLNTLYDWGSPFYHNIEKLLLYKSLNDDLINKNNDTSGKSKI